MGADISPVSQVSRCILAALESRAHIRCSTALSHTKLTRIRPGPLLYSPKQSFTFLYKTQKCFYHLHWSLCGHHLAYRSGRQPFYPSILSALLILIDWLAPIFASRSLWILLSHCICFIICWIPCRTCIYPNTATHTEQAYICAHSSRWVRRCPCPSPSTSSLFPALLHMHLHTSELPWHTAALLTAE